MRTKITHVEERYQHFAIETAEQNRANLFDKIVTGRPNAYLSDTDRAGRALARWGRTTGGAEGTACGALFARVRARGRYTIRHGYASAPEYAHAGKILRDHRGPW